VLREEDRSKEEEVLTKTHTRHRAQKHTYTVGFMEQRGNIQGKRTDNTIRIPEARSMSLNIAPLIIHPRYGNLIGIPGKNGQGITC
jgi:hypothetical protein